MCKYLGHVFIAAVPCAAVFLCCSLCVHFDCLITIFCILNTIVPSGAFYRVIISLYSVFQFVGNNMQYALIEICTLILSIEILSVLSIEICTQGSMVTL